MQQSTDASAREARALAERVAGIVREEVGETVAVFWFGSWVRGTAAPRSDVDVAFDAGAPLPPARRARLLERIEALPTLRGVDLVDLRACGAELADRVRREGEAL